MNTLFSGSFLTPIVQILKISKKIRKEAEGKERENRHVVSNDGCVGLPSQSVNKNRCVIDCVVGLCDAYMECLLAGCFGSMEHIWY